MLADYARLERCAVDAAAWPAWRERAFTHARESAASDRCDGTQLVELHVREGELDTAWDAALEFGCDRAVQLRVAELREVQHPAVSAAFYLAQLDATLDTNAKRRYDDAIGLLARADALLATEVERATFDAAVVQLRERHKLKRTLLAKLDARGW